MRTARLRAAGAAFVADPSGALVWPEQDLLVVADLHLEKGSALARRGRLLPPYDTRTTLARLEAVLARWPSRRVISLGDGFHDRAAAGRLGAEDRDRLARLTAAHDWLWVAGNHDPGPPTGCRGRAETAVRVAGITFRHLPDPAAEPGEVAGHLHPSASLTVRGRRLSRRCFVADERRLILPAFGSYAGGLDVFDPAIAALFAGGFRATLLGDGRVHALAQQRLDARRRAAARPGPPIAPLIRPVAQAVTITASLGPGCGSAGRASMIQPSRIRLLNQRPPAAGEYVLYWMQQSQRAAFNPALECAVDAANRRGLPVVVGFGLMDAYPEANRRHYAFMLQGLQEVERNLRARGIGLVIRRGNPADVALDLSARATFLVCDRGYLRHQKQWRAAVARAARCQVVQVEGDVVVPIEEASDRREVGARTLRPKLHRIWDAYLGGLDEARVVRGAGQLELRSEIDLADLDRVLDRLDLDASVAPVRRFRGGTSAARERLDDFLSSGLDGYAGGRSEPGAYRCSQLSPYLHFGQISPVEIALRVRATGGDRDRAVYLEELIVRRELSMNFVEFEASYDRYDALPDWAQATLRAHREDRREHVYDCHRLEAADTHDPYWNAAMAEMVHTGYMHNTMRMYWAKKILEWSRTPEDAFATTLHLNNRYFLDGRDANSYANVAWSFGLHDRPWPERPVFGKVRYMNVRGLERKFDMRSYLQAVDRLIAEERS